MRRMILFFALILTAQVVCAQSTFRGKVHNEETKQPVAGAKVSVRGTEISAMTDASGKLELLNIPAGDQTIEVQAEGYEVQELNLNFPLTDQTERLISLPPVKFEMTVSSTRTGREIEDTPTRVEAIDEEEVDEKSNMRPANVSMVLSESTGIQVQQTSATSFTQTIRIQGLDGRYTQILKDGFPAYGGFSGSLSVLEIPPLDLKQVEVIKGPSATFYGGGAIAGVVNFISKEPEDRPVTNLIFNQTSARGTDFSIFNSRRFARFGYTFLGSANYQKEYDADDDDFTELPKTTSFNLSPRLFFYLNDKSRFVLGNSLSYQNRQGGDVFVIDGRADSLHRYFENNSSVRNITTLQFDRDFSGGRRVSARQSLAFFTREIEIPDYRFNGRQFNSYTDLSYLHPLENHALVFGLNAVFDSFRERPNGPASLIRRDETRATVGGYVQDSFDVTSQLLLEAGFRIDVVKVYGAFALPRVSVLYRFNDHLSTRASFGLGYKTPTIFTEDAETLLFRNVLPIGNGLKAERSRGGTVDLNYRNTLGDKFTYSLNLLYFYTVITDPLVLMAEPSGLFSFANAAQPIKSQGFETNAKFTYDFVKLFLGYTFTDARAEYLSNDQFLPLVPKHKINSALLFEKAENFKAGIEAYYTGSQFLSNGFKTRPFLEVGIFAEKNVFGKYSLFMNAENITDVRQSRFTPVVLPPHQSPTFREIYTHTEGRVLNGGIKIKL